MDAKLGHGTNLVGLPTPLIGSAVFNDAPRAMRISGVREMNPSLFEMLTEAPDLAEAADGFFKYMIAAFGIDAEQRAEPESGGRGWRRPFKSSFLRLLLGWGRDSNGPEGAVMKGWVESRFGLFPTFHKEPVVGFSGPAWAAYVAEKMGGPFHNNAILAQLDLLFEYAQWVLARFVAPGESHLVLYRGVNDFAEHPMTRRIDRRTLVVRFNNLVSFTTEREIAECFGTTLLRVEVPVVKVLFLPALLPFFPLKSEAEVIAIGGETRVTVL